MKGAAILRKILFSSWFLAGIPAILIIIFLPPSGLKYKLSVEPSGRLPIQLIYEDMNSDGISEMVFSAKGIPYFHITVKDYDLRIYDQWNLADSLDAKLSDFFVGNFDHDRYKEIYVFTHKEDSLFLNVNEFLEPSGTKLERIFITKIGYLKGQVAAVLKPAGFFDENGDGKDELYFSISSGFRSGPRRLYSFDLISRDLKSSQFTGSICLNPKMVDADEDLKPEIFGTMSASGNYRTNVPFSDSSTWFMVFNDRLEFKFPPVGFPGFGNGLEINFFKNGASRGFVLVHWAGGADTTILKSRIMIYSTEGKLVRYRLLNDIGSFPKVNSFVFNNNQSDRICLIGDKIIELNDQLDAVQTIRLPYHSITASYQFDINNDGQDELLIYSEDEEKLAVYSSGLQKLAEQGILTPTLSWKFSHYFSRDHEHKLFMSSEDSGYFLKLNKNNYYWLSFLSYPGIYFLFFFFILIVRRINTWQVEQKESLKRRLVTLQLQGIKAQLDPHFTFNTLNSVSSLIYLEDREAAYDYLNKFTQLLRGMLNDAERIYRSVGEELEFVTTYLDLEKLRFGEKLNYEIEIGEGVNQKEQVPKLVLQTFAENSIKHGIIPRDEGGILKIKIDKGRDYLKLIIEDNGIGRARSAGHSTSTGKGLKITGEFYDILNQINKKPIKHLITDLHNVSGDPSGTRVEVWVPLDMEQDNSRK
jgi:two-component sensor histidine kinase